MRLEDILKVVEGEEIDFVMVEFGGERGMNVGEGLEKGGVRLLGRWFERVDGLEDGDLLYELVDEVNLADGKGDRGD
ncbi:hypothetical protein [Bacillus altitudinis]|uniref:hypothetical protein n=1 Tax=Bacillus altitudinis TaxID=293387 RepID=UPI00119E6E30|nr:hypothetical protein [Bacillus altitudinis]